MLDISLEMDLIPFFKNCHNENRIEINYSQKPKIDDDVIINKKSNESCFNL